MAVDKAIRSIEKWKTQESSDLYNVPGWGKGYFSVGGNGHLLVHPDKNPVRSIDLFDLIGQLKTRGINSPVLLRFPGILEHRLGDIYEAFRAAISESGYKGRYHCVYPVKVNQQCHVVNEYMEFGRKYKFGLEAGSKPELLAVIALVDDNETPILCNGFKDAEFIEAVILAAKMGKNIIPIVEKFSEFKLIAKFARRHGVRPRIGVRVKLVSRGVGRWESSAGVRSKFGLSIPELLRGLEYLRQNEMQDCLKLLHFHMGSQVSNIRNIKSAISEAARIYCELVKAGAGMEYLDVGGGLGVDYDGSQTNFESSVNYTLAEYANDVIFRIMTVCDEADVPHPIVMSESGRAVISYHSMLVFNVLGSSGPERMEVKSPPDEEAPQPLHDLWEVSSNLGQKNFLESYHDAVQAREEAINLFNLGYLSLERRAYAESLFWTLCEDVRKLLNGAAHVPEDLENLDEMLADTYFCNFSVFQSIPDSWAIRQLFPVMPIHRLEEMPTRKAVIADITCDSDGKIDAFIDLRDVKKTLELHPYNGKDYYLGLFLIGAYQEILGDLHNLFGDTHAVHVSLDDDGEINLDHVVSGDTVSEVLSYVQYDPKELAGRVRRDVEKAVREKRMELEESAQLMRFYVTSLNGYTYLEDHTED